MHEQKQNTYKRHLHDIIARVVPQKIPLSVTNIRALLACSGAHGHKHCNIFHALPEIVNVLSFDKAHMETHAAA